jgi:hypothetical protein
MPQKLLIPIFLYQSIAVFYSEILLYNMHCKDTNFSWVFGFFGGEKIFFVYLHGGCFWEGWRKVLWGCE